MKFRGVGLVKWKNKVAVIFGAGEPVAGGYVVDVTDPGLILHLETLGFPKHITVPVEVVKPETPKRKGKK